MDFRDPGIEVDLDPSAPEASSGFAAFRYDPIWLCSFVVLGEICA